MRDFAEVSINLHPKDFARASPSKVHDVDQLSLGTKREEETRAYLALRPVALLLDHTCCQLR